jgi:hypothetical protein
VICCCICSLFLTRYYFSQDTTNHTFENKARAFHAALNFFFCPQIMVFTVVLTLYVVAIQIAKFSMDYNNKFIYISNAGFNLYVLVLYTWGCSIATADVLQQFMDFGIVAHHSMSRLLAGIYRNICRLLGLESGRPTAAATYAPPRPLPESVYSLFRKFIMFVFFDDAGTPNILPEAANGSVKTGTGATAFGVSSLESPILSSFHMGVTFVDDSDHATNTNASAAESGGVALHGKLAEKIITEIKMDDRRSEYGRGPHPLDITR